MTETSETKHEDLRASLDGRIQYDELKKDQIYLKISRGRKILETIYPWVIEEKWWDCLDRVSSDLAPGAYQLRIYCKGKRFGPPLPFSVEGEIEPDDPIQRAIAEKAKLAEMKVKKEQIDAILGSGDNAELMKFLIQSNLQTQQMIDNQAKLLEKLVEGRSQDNSLEGTLTLIERVRGAYGSSPQEKYQEKLLDSMADTMGKFVSRIARFSGDGKAAELAAINECIKGVSSGLCDVVKAWKHPGADGEEEVEEDGEAADMSREFYRALTMLVQSARRKIEPAQAAAALRRQAPRVTAELAQYSIPEIVSLFRQTAEASDDNVKNLIMGELLGKHKEYLQSVYHSLQTTTPKEITSDTTTKPNPAQ